MEYRNSYERIDNVTDIDYISNQICKKYMFKKYINYELIEIGYEDFNYILNTEDNKYVVKIFNSERDDSSCKRLIDILVKSMENDIPVPKIFTVNGDYIFTIKMNNIVLRLFVMEYIDGKNFWELNRELTNNELKQVAQIASNINSIDYNIKEVFYDEWTVTNLKLEYEKKKHCLTTKENKIIQKIVEEFELIDFDKMKYSYIHGDIIKANLILDPNGKIYVIDFSAFNYLPRIIEIAASLLGLCLTDSKNSTIKNINRFLGYYNLHNTLENNEIEKLPLILKALASMYIIQTRYIKSNSGDYLENDYWLSEGVKFLSMNIEQSDICVQ